MVTVGVGDAQLLLAAVVVRVAVVVIGSAAAERPQQAAQRQTEAEIAFAKQQHAWSVCVPWLWVGCKPWRQVAGQRKQAQHLTSEEREKRD